MYHPWFPARMSNRRPDQASSTFLLRLAYLPLRLYHHGISREPFSLSFTYTYCTE
ncbi:hypothetical protein Hypma_006771 [Hypsizygus marmoreus]|uniref:Uncharacterized protein n=1 Tax=Hypsizygus marmoreus TaxID=39966 RepID=A0A369JVJ5_HYPMA|nr:hypothetical protein Hypma_006771 [Hypsizygus marmoreus]